MHPRIGELLSYVQRQRVSLLDAVSLIPEPLGDQRGDAETCSAAEVLEHLHRVESGIVRLIDRSLERAKETGAEPESETGSLLASLDALRILDRGLRIRAPEPVMPRGELTAAQE